MIIFIIPRIYPWLYSDCDILLWICMYCLKLYLLYLIIIVLRATGKISLLLLTVLPSWNKVITYLLWPNNITTFFPFTAMFYLTCVDHVLLFVDDVVTSWPQTKISDWSEIKCIVILAVQNRTCSIPKCVSCNF
jgi:hypothetical protein